MTDAIQREKRHAALYFSPKNSKAYKELAARIRSDGGRTTLIWSNQWKGAESILTECRAIVVQKECANADDIVEAYRRYAQDVEVHYADASGEFSEDSEEGTTVSDAMEATEENGEATDEEKHDDSDTTPDAVVEEATDGEATDPVDPDSNGEVVGTEDDGAEAGDEKPTDQS